MSSALFNLVAQITMNPSVAQAALEHDLGNAAYAKGFDAAMDEIFERLPIVAPPVDPKELK